ncbi:hypothetical protein SDC9_166818 [bioreactor metagenome]|uniref:Uncharacterized protein n=1 Tax=bioreactor metagenome TaxID=1076179 RepID=A0A645G0V3_9ZZZZ
MKKITLITVALLMTATLNVFAMNPVHTESGDSNAQGSAAISPMWVAISQISSTLTFDNGKAICKVTVEVPKTMADTASFSLDLQRQEGAKWVTVKSWSETANVAANCAIFSKSYSVRKGYNYKFSGKVTCYKNGSLVESASVSSVVQYY